LCRRPNLIVVNTDSKDVANVIGLLHISFRYNFLNSVYLYLFMIQKVFLFFLLVFLSIDAYTQINNELLEQKWAIDDSTQEQVSLAIESRSFFKNNEYFGDLVTGYTLMGSQLSTQLAYQAGRHIRLQGGVYMVSDFGNNTLRKVSPVFTLKMQKNGYSVLFGSLEGNLSHRLIEPLFNYERYITHNVENGLQIKIDRKRIWSDTWLNWEVMQYLNSNYQEQFSAGHSSQIHLVEHDRFKLDLPIQGLVTHRGGQIDTVNTPLETTMNAAIGISASFKLNSFINRLHTQHYYTIYRDLSPTQLIQYSQGHGLFFNLEATTKAGVGASIGYWQGYQYYAGRGGFLYQSIASAYGKKGEIQSNRQIAFLRLLYQKPVYKGLSVDVRFEPYYDLGNSLFEYSYSVYLTYKNDFGIVNLTKRK
jgi:hypothetical protein